MTTPDPKPSPQLGGEILAGTGAAVAGAAISGAVGPEAGEVVAGALAPVLARVAQLDGRSLSNVDAVLRSALETAGADAEALALWSDGSPERLRLLGQVIEAAFHAMDDARIPALARVLADTYEDDAMLDAAPLIVAALRELEPIHVRVLAMMMRRPQDAVEAHDASWALEHLKFNLPQVSIGMEPVLATLERVGAVYASAGYGGPMLWQVTDFGRLCVARLGEESVDAVEVEVQEP